MLPTGARNIHSPVSVLSRVVRLTFFGSFSQVDGGKYGIPLFTEVFMNKETLLMASEQEIADKVPQMEWSTAVQVVEWCVDEM